MRLVRKGIRIASLCLHIEGKSEGKKDGVPVNLLLLKIRLFKFANWPNSAGMGPGVYKTQSKHTKSKSRHRTGAKGHKDSKPIPSYLMQVRGKDGWSTGKLVSG
jgi:hypothetical protein